MKTPVWIQVLMILSVALLFWSGFCLYQQHLKVSDVIVSQAQGELGSFSLSYRHRNGGYDHWLRSDTGETLSMISNDFGFQGELPSEAQAALTSAKQRHHLGMYKDADGIANFPLKLELKADRVAILNGYGKRMVFKIDATP